MKEYFEAGKIPTEDQFADLIDSSLNKSDDQVYVKTVGSGKELKKQLGIGEANPDARLHISGGIKLENGTAVNEIVDDITSVSENDRNAVPTVWALRELISDHLVGSVTAFATDEVPPGWVECDGRLIDLNLSENAKFQKLFSRIGSKFGRDKKNKNSFRLPDLRGEFIRGWDGSKFLESEGESGHKGIDGDSPSRFDISGKQIGNVIGSYQDDALQGHGHSGIHLHGDPNAKWSDPCYGSLGSGRTYPDNYAVTHFVSDGRGTPRTAGETRPRNIALMYCIKY